MYLNLLYVLPKLFHYWIATQFTLFRVLFQPKHISYRHTAV